LDAAVDRRDHAARVPKRLLSARSFPGRVQLGSPVARHPLTAIDHRLQGLEAVGVGATFVPANAMDAREAHGDTRLVSRGLLYRVECHLEHELGFDRANRSKALDRSEERRG